MTDREVTTVDNRQARWDLADDDSAATRLVHANEQCLGGRLGLADHLVERDLASNLVPLSNLPLRVQDCIPTTIGLFEKVMDRRGWAFEST